MLSNVSSEEDIVLEYTGLKLGKIGISGNAKKELRKCREWKGIKKYVTTVNRR